MSQVEFVTIEKAELARMIESSVTKALSRVLSPPDKPLTKQQLAEDQNTSIATITRWMAMGMPYLKGGHPRFRKSEVEMWRASLLE